MSDFPLLVGRTLEGDLPPAVRDRLGTPVTPEFYGAVGDGTINDTAALAAAVAAAGQGGQVWLARDYLTTGSVAGLWNARLVGPGAILRGGVRFPAEPKTSPSAVVERHLYVHGTAGSNANDGLGPNQAVQTLDRLRVILQTINADEAANSRWVVNLAGSITGGMRFERLAHFSQGLVFRGEPLVSGRPVTTISRGGPNPQDMGLYFEPGRANVRVERLKFVGFTNGFNGYGLLMKSGGTLTAEDCEAVNCDCGFAAINNVIFYFNRCRATEQTKGHGFRAQYSASGTFNDCTVSGATVTGIVASRNAVAHVDYCTLTDNAIGLTIDMAARVAAIENDFMRNDVGVRASGAAEWTNGENDFHLGTANANDVAFEHYGNGRESRLYSDAPARSEYRLGSSYDLSPFIPDPTITGTTGTTLVYFGSRLGVIPAGFFTTPGKRLRFVVTGTITGTLGGERALRVIATEADSSNQVTLAEVRLKVGASGAFVGETVVHAMTTTTQREITRVSANVPSVASSDRTVNFATAKWLRLYLLGMYGDTITVTGMETHLMG